MKNFKIGLFAMILLFALSSWASEPNRYEQFVVGKLFGQATQMNYTYATHACKPRQLSTVLDLALMAQELGARGVLEIKGNIPVQPTYDGYTLIVDTETNYQFYYDNLGYKSPGGLIGRNNFWSISGHLLDGRTGHIWSEYDLNGLSAVICLSLDLP